MKRILHDWDFPYEAPSHGPTSDGRELLDVVIATYDHVPTAAFSEALQDLGTDVVVETLLARAPLYWTRVRSATVRIMRADVAEILSRARIAVRYLASARVGTMALPPSLDFADAPPVHGAGWRVRRQRSLAVAPTSGGLWFLGEGGGIRMDRAVCRTGAGTRLAVIDDDTADFEHLELDRTTCVGVERSPTVNGHAALMIAWASGAIRSDGSHFAGIAPDTSVRAYCISKAGIDVFSLPLAIARAVFEGADVIVCATYVEGTTSPMLDDALEVAVRLGRKGRGSVVVLPTGREASSPEGSVHASLSLTLGDPASDPRVHCVAPGGRRGGWFLFPRLRDGKLRPFANRGPAVRWTAPGDDIAHPFSTHERLFHAESSGASAIAAGVVALVLGCNPALQLHELHSILSRTADAPGPTEAAEANLVDPADVLPLGRDPDGHDAKHGYGRLNATRACAAARDPFALALLAMGEEEAARGWSTCAKRPYSADLSGWAVRTLLSRPDIEHAVRAVLRHARLIAARPSRARTQTPGALARQLALLARSLLAAQTAPPKVREELRRTTDVLTRACADSDLDCARLENGVLDLFRTVWSSSSATAQGQSATVSETLRSA